ncbi:hypothetical protein PG999_012046 [Apiospora kogelbergensis]|uniref:C2H2-type domain-containing protein n=1 Tax=Apiospora kogelbergensis TaxID=1337665 RepID=A0AAW0QG26_9PEZI
MGNPYGWRCWTCWGYFGTKLARQHHTTLTGHEPPVFECNKCSHYFGSEATQFKHMEDMNHFAFDCCRCSLTWPTEDQLTSHQHEKHNYCAECDRVFMSYNNLKQHLHSRRHLGQSIGCPFCGSCWVTAAGMTHHLESGACPKASKVNRDTLYKFVRSKDPGGVFTKNLVGYQGSTYYEANEQSYNPYRGGYQCYLCHSLFSSLQGLTQHLNSPTHQQPLYHCPNRITCDKEFKSLASIINHLESESCGFVRFEKVQRGFQDLLNMGRQIKFQG